MTDEIFTDLILVEPEDAPPRPDEVGGYVDDQKINMDDYVPVMPNEMNESFNLTPGGYEPSTESIWNKNVITEKPFTTEEEQFKRKMELRGYKTGPSRARNVASYITFDNQDEIEAGVRSLFGADYKETRNKLRGQLQNYQVDNLAESIILGIGGSLLTGYGAISALSKFPKAYKLVMSQKGSTLAEKAKRLMIGGGVAGFTQGVGTASELENIPSWATAAYTGTGILAAPILSAGLKGVTVIAGSANDAIKTLFKQGNFPEAKNEAVMRIAKQLENAGLDAKQIESELKKMRKAGVSGPQLFETNKVIKDEARRSLTVPTVSDIDVVDAFGARLLETPKVLKNKIKKIFGVNEEIDSSFLENIIESQRKKAQEKYPNLKKINIPKNNFISTIGDGNFNVLKSELIKKYYNKWRTKQGSRTWKGNKSLPTYEQFLKLDEIPTEFLQGIKRKIDDDIGVGMRKGEYMGDLIDRKKEFNKMIESGNPQYRAANEEFADSEKLKDIFAQGKKYIDLDENELNNYVKTLDEDQLKVFKAGVLNNITEKANKFTGGNFTQKIFGSEQQKLIFKKLMGGNSNDYKEFEALAKYGSKRIKSTSDIAFGSQTSLRDLADKNLIVPGGPGTQILNALRKMIDANLIPPAVAEQTKKMLINATEAEQIAILKSLKNIEKKGKLKLPSPIVNNPFTQIFGLLGAENVFDTYSKADNEANKQPYSFEGLL